MTTLLERSAATASSGQARGVTRLPTGSRGRKPLLTVASALVVLASVAVFAGIYSSANHQVAVVMVTRTIEQGHHITASDLGSVGVSTSGGFTPVPVADASELSGKWAAETIPAGSLLTLGDVTSARPLPVGTAVVGLALKDGQMPSGGVLPGDQVMMVQTPGAGAVLPYAGSADSSSGTADGGDANGADATSGVLVAQATVFDVATPSASSSGTAELVSVEVPSTLAASVATASAADQVSVVLLPAGPADTASSAFSNGTGTGPGSQDGGSS